MPQRETNANSPIEMEARRSLKNVKIQKYVGNVLASFLIPTFLAVLVGVAGADLISVTYLVTLSILIILQLVFGVLMVIEPKTALSEYFREKDLVAEVQQRDNALDRLERSIESVSTHTGIAQAWSVIGHEHAALNVAELTEDRLTDKVKQIMEPVVREKDILFGIDENEKWNFAVYRVDNEANTLVPIWREKASNHPAGGNGRRWARGEGHVGVAYTQNEPIYSEDARIPDVAKLISAPSGKQKEYDSAVYISLASVPIALSADMRCHGVLAATSDRPGRFNEVNSNVLEHAAVVLANLLEQAHNPT